jgi:hypothetical protein
MIAQSVLLLSLIANDPARGLGKHKPEEFIDASFVDELGKSGFIEKLYEK